MSSILASGSVLHERYTIQRVIENTDSERLYLAEDQAQYDEECLVREIIPKSSDMLGEAIGRFQEEFGEFVDLRHSHLQRMKEIFCEGRSFFVVQAYVEGESYQELLQNSQSFREIEAINFLKQLLPALNYVHSKNLAHGAIAPLNIILRIHDQQPVLANFGILNEIRDFLDVKNSESEFLTAIFPDSHSMHEKTCCDVYSLAATAMVLLTGKNPNELLDKNSGKWRWDNWVLLSNEFDDILNRILNEQNSDIASILHALNLIRSASMPHLPVQKLEEIISTPLSVSPIPLQHEMKTNGIKDHRNWLIALGIGGLLTLVGVGSTLIIKDRLNGGISSLDSSRAQSLGASQNDLEMPSSPPLNSPSGPGTLPESPQEIALTEEMAVGIVQKWLQAKSEAFSPPFSLTAINQYTTGKYREDRAGVVNWLENNNAYYEFRPPSVQPTGQFSQSGQKAFLEVRVTEERTLYVNGRVDPQNSGITASTYRFTLQLEGNVWKIANAEEIS